MKSILISLMFVLLFVVGSCGGEDEYEVVKKNFPHEHDGLDWSNASSDEMPWDGAIEYCENLGGRLPTISELRTLIQNCPATETGGSCGVTDSCLSYNDCEGSSCSGCSSDSSGKYSVFGDTYWFWSSSEQSDTTDVAWSVDFDSGYVLYYYKNLNYFVRCVR